MQKLILSLVMTIFMVPLAFADAWVLKINYAATNGVGVTEIRGVTEKGAAISVVDANGGRLFCNKLLGIVNVNPDFSCSGLNVEPPLTVTASKSALSLLSSKTDKVRKVRDLNANNEPWLLSVTESNSLFFGLMREYKGTSEQGAYVSMMGANEAPLFCLTSILPVNESGEFSCIGFGVEEPVTAKATAGLTGLFGGRVDTTTLYTSE